MPPCHFGNHFGRKTQKELVILRGTDQTKLRRIAVSLVLIILFVILMCSTSGSVGIVVRIGIGVRVVRSALDKVVIAVFFAEDGFDGVDGGGFVFPGIGARVLKKL